MKANPNTTRTDVRSDVLYISSFQKLQIFQTGGMVWVTVEPHNPVYILSGGAVFKHIFAPGAPD